MKGKWKPSELLIWKTLSCKMKALWSIKLKNDTLFMVSPDKQLTKHIWDLDSMRHCFSHDLMGDLNKNYPWVSCTEPWLSNMAQRLFTWLLKFAISLEKRENLPCMYARIQLLAFGQEFRAVKPDLPSFSYRKLTACITWNLWQTLTYL